MGWLGLNFTIFQMSSVFVPRNVFMTVDTGAMLFELKIVMKLSGSIFFSFFERETDFENESTF